MARSAMMSLLGPEFGASLFASVREQSSGGLLSVRSALARLDVDPWLEAIELARMPREAANQRLTSLIAELHDVPSARLPAATIAARLARLLPHREISAVAARAKLLGRGHVPNSRMIANMILINLLVMAAMLCAQWALANLQPPARVGAVHAPAAGAVMPQVRRHS